MVAKHLGIPLLNHHRAVEDAKTTGDILLKAFEDLKDKEIMNLNMLNEEYFKNQDIKKSPTYHVIILVKNKIGLKNLYKLISESHLNHFYKNQECQKVL